MSERTWLASTASASASPAGRRTARRHLPMATIAGDAAARRRAPRHVADLLVRQPFELAQHDHLTEFRRQAIERATQRFPRRPAQQLGLRMLVRHRAAVLRLVELRREHLGAPAAPQAVSRIAHDRQQPGARAALVVAAEAVEMLERPQAGVLNDVLRLVLVPHQVARQRVRGIEVRQDDGFESRHVQWAFGNRRRGGPEYSRRNNPAGRVVSVSEPSCSPTLAGGRSPMSYRPDVTIRNVLAVLALAVVAKPTPRAPREPVAAVAISAKLSEWKVELS